MVNMSGFGNAHTIALNMPSRDKSIKLNTINFKTTKITKTIQAIIKTNQSESWSSHVFSNQSLTGDGSVTFRAKPNLLFVVGLSPTNSLLSQAFSMEFYNNQISIKEAGIHIAFDVSSYTENDILSIKRTGATITYLKNNAVLYTSTVSSAGQLFIDISLHDIDSEVYDVKLNNLPVTWRDITNAKVDDNYNYEIIGPFREIQTKVPDRKKPIVLNVPNREKSILLNVRTHDLP